MDSTVASFDPREQRYTIILKVEEQDFKIKYKTKKQIEELQKKAPNVSSPGSQNEQNLPASTMALVFWGISNYLKPSKGIYDRNFDGNECIGAKFDSRNNKYTITLKIEKEEFERKAETKKQVVAEAQEGIGRAANTSADVDAQCKLSKIAK